MLTTQTIDTELGATPNCKVFFAKHEELELGIKQLVLTARSQEELESTKEVYGYYQSKIKELYDSLAPDDENKIKLRQHVLNLNKGLVITLNNHSAVIEQLPLTEDLQQYIDRVDYLYENLQLFEKKDVSKKEVRKLVNFFIHGDKLNAHKEVQEEYKVKVNDIQSFYSNK